MPNVASAANERFARKLGRAFNKLAEPCQFISASGAAPYQRGVSLQQTERDGSAEYVPEPVQVAEFLKADGAVNTGDLFELPLAENPAQQYQLTQLYESDQVSVSYIYIAY
ncbi:hypothetical protein [Shewanella sp. MBTL60-007]|uniref:hypothetical protein n=1 Tax=Shewanella sp. MBTL60-007 TaxID=2815911 RepID=UPI001BC60772|nr:hypothetical protein [Shewanella sp. MBTL60-007]GIU22231.1 hypothetical protein TUM3792_24100 [Shewanella sp. MBTL60-007]